MGELKRTGDAVYELKYHFVWIPKYRRKVLTEEIKEKLKEIFLQIAEKYDFEIIEQQVISDRVHLFLSAPPRYSPARLVNIIKNISRIAVTREDPPYLKRLVRGELPVVLLDRKIKGLPLDSSLIKYGDFRMEKARKATEEFMKMKNRPTALFVANNVMVMGAFKALKENEVKIPQEMALVGFYDPEWASLTGPPLTTVRQPTYSIGTMACQDLLQRIRKRSKEIVR